MVDGHRPRAPVEPADQLPRCAGEHHAPAVAHRIDVRAGEHDACVPVAGVVDGRHAHGGLAPAALRHVVHRSQRRQGSRYVRRRRDLGVAECLVEEVAAAVATVGRVHHRGHVGEHEEDQPAVGDDEVKRQRRDARQVVGVEPRALALPGAEREEVGEDPLVRDHARDEGDQHEHRTDAHQPTGGRGWQVLQRVVELVQGLTASGRARAKGCAGGGIQGLAAAKRAAGGIGPGAPTDRHVRHVVTTRWEDGPLRRSRSHLLKPRQRQGQPVHLRQGGRREGRLRPHPLVDLAVEVAEGAGEEHEEEHPPHRQACPRMEPRHRSAQTAPHGRRDPPNTASAAKVTMVMRRPSQACRTVRAPKHHTTAAP